jgi:hypothetical protein
MGKISQVQGQMGARTKAVRPFYFARNNIKKGA